MNLGKGLLSTAVMVGLSLSAMTANAALTLSGSVGGAPNLAAVNKWNFDNGLSYFGPVATPLATITFAPNAGFVTGESSGVYAPPWLSGGNGAGFGSNALNEPDGSNQADGADATKYVTTGSTGVPGGGVAGAKATITFSTDQLYLGLLWGSVDSYNTVSFYRDGNLLKSFTGSNVLASPDGDQGVNGTLYVNITGAGAPDAFDTVVFESSNFAFEFDNVAFGVDPLIPAVPLPAAAWLLLSGLGGLGILGRRRKTA